MADIIRMDKSRRRIEERRRIEKRGRREDYACEHKNVTVYAEYRSVRCSFCGASLDPFDVLLDMVRGYIPAESPRDRD